MSPFRDRSLGEVKEIDDVKTNVRCGNTKTTTIGGGKRDRLFRAQPVLLLLPDSFLVAFLLRRDIDPEDSAIRRK